MLIVDNVDWPRLPNTSEGKTFAIPGRIYIEIKIVLEYY